MEIKQHAIEQPMGQIRNQRNNKKIPWDKWKYKHNLQKSMGCSKISCKREIYSDTGQPPRRKIKNKQSNFTPKGSRKGKTK